MAIEKAQKRLITVRAEHDRLKCKQQELEDKLKLIRLYLSFLNFLSLLFYKKKKWRSSQ